MLRSLSFSPRWFLFTSKCSSSIRSHLSKICNLMYVKDFRNNLIERFAKRFHMKCYRNNSTESFVKLCVHMNNFRNISAATFHVIYCKILSELLHMKCERSKWFWNLTESFLQLSVLYGKHQFIESKLNISLYLWINNWIFNFKD